MKSIQSISRACGIQGKNSVNKYWEIQSERHNGKRLRNQILNLLEVFEGKRSIQVRLKHKGTQLGNISVFSRYVSLHHPKWGMKIALKLVWSFLFGCIILIYRIYTGYLVFLKRPQRKDILLTWATAGTKHHLAKKLKMPGSGFYTTTIPPFDLATLDVISNIRAVPLNQLTFDKMLMRNKIHPFSFCRLCRLTWLLWGCVPSHLGRGFTGWSCFLFVFGFVFYFIFLHLSVTNF